jgi:hypothetical protein
MRKQGTPRSFADAEVPVLKALAQSPFEYLVSAVSKRKLVRYFHVRKLIGRHSCLRKEKSSWYSARLKRYVALEAAVDGQVLTRHVSRIVGSKEGKRRRHLGWLCEPA